MAGKLGIHGDVPSPELAAIVRSAPWAAVKMVGDTSMLQVAADAGIPVRVLREYGTDDMAPQDAANRIYTYDLRPVTAIQLLCETSKAWDLAWQADFRDALYSLGWRGVVTVVNASTGNPTDYDATTHPPSPHFPLLQQVAPLLIPGAAGKTEGSRLPTWLGLDCYEGVTEDDARYAANDPWTVNRDTLDVRCLARHGVDLAALLAIILETGEDQTIPGVPQGGWQLRTTPAEYVKTRILVDQGDQRKPWLVARCDFTYGPTPDWRQKGFDMTPLAPDLAAYQRSQAANTWQPQLSPPPAAPPSGKVHRRMNAIPELDQGWTKACWAYATAECFDAAGYYVSPLDIYAQVKGKLLTPPGDAATFAELRAAINAAASVTSARLKWFGPLGVANDPGTVAQLVRDGWYVIAGIQESDLQPGQDYGHYVIIRSVADPNAVAIVDSYRAEDGGSDRYPWAQLVKAMADNWDSAVDALAFQIVG